MHCSMASLSSEALAKVQGAGTIALIMWGVIIPHIMVWRSGSGSLLASARLHAALC